MEGIEFDKESYAKPIAYVAPKQSRAVKLVRKIGGKYIKSDAQASLVLIVLAVLFFIIAIYNFISIGRHPSMSPAERAQSDALMQQQLNAARNHAQ